MLSDKNQFAKSEQKAQFVAELIRLSKSHCASKPMTPAEQIRLMKSSKHVHSRWYRETYPDVAALGLDPAAHYLRYGAAMGRNPGKNFDTKEKNVFTSVR